jgi:hypothetical protein
MAVVRPVVILGSDTASVIASIVAAAATLLLATFTFWMARKTSEVAKETARAVAQSVEEFKLGQTQLKVSKDQVAASNSLFELGQAQLEVSRDQAAASTGLVTEARSDRELAAQPMMSVHRHADESPPNAELEIVLKNVGLGPAVACRYVESYREEGRMTWAEDIGPGSEAVAHQTQTLSDPETKTLLQWFDASRTCRYAPAAIFARDVLGTKYQFLLAYNAVGQLVVDQIEEWSPGLVGGPEWAVSQLVWPNNWSRWARRTVTHPITGSQTVLVTETVPGDGSEVNQPPREIVREYPAGPSRPTP